MNQQEGQSQHISGQFDAELEGVKNRLMEMGGLVEQQISRAVEALLKRDSGEAEEVRKLEPAVNEMEVLIDEECSRILARRQPAASDLRLVLAIIKITTDLERVGDEANKIAKQTIKLSEADATGDSSRYVEIRHIGLHVASMLRKVLDAFARLDVDTAVEVIVDDQTVDRQYKHAMRSSVTFMMEDPRTIGGVLNEMWSLRSLERVGDHACNIAEQVVYLTSGQDVRHVDTQQLLDQFGQED